MSWTHCLKWLLLPALAIGGVVAPLQAGANVSMSSRIASAYWSEAIGNDSGQCLDVHKSSTKAETQLILYGCHNGDNQSFRLKDGNLESSRIAVYTGSKELCLGARLRNGWHRVMTERCSTAPSWKAGRDGRLQLLHSPLVGDTCMEVHPQSRHMVLMPCSWSNASFGTNWTLPDAQPGPLLAPHTVKPLVNPDECLDVHRQGRNPGTKMLHARCVRGGAHQLFQVRGDKAQAMLTVYQGKEMLCVANVGGPTMRVIPCNPVDLRQRWNVFSAGANFYTLTNYRTQWCLDVSKASDATTAACSGSARQAWLIRD
jgi:hypothetical protein